MSTVTSWLVPLRESWLPRCSNERCGRGSWRDRISSKFSGVSISEEWYCCPDCFEVAARAKLSRLLAAHMPPHDHARLRMPLGLMLLSRELITAEQFKEALKRQQISGASMADVVQELGYVDEHEVTAAVAAQWSCPVFVPREDSAGIAFEVPRTLLETYRFVPVHYAESAKRVLVGFVDAVHDQILSTIEHITGCKASPCFITRSNFRRALAFHAGGQVERGIVFDRASGPSEVAKVARDYLLQLHAVQARFGMCRDYLWTRLLEGRREMDLLFRIQPN